MSPKGKRSTAGRRKPNAGARTETKSGAGGLPAARTISRVTPSTWRQDPRRWIYVAADLLFTIGYLMAFTALLHNRFGWARGILYILPTCTVGMAIGTMVGGRGGWMAVVIGAAGMLVWTVAFIIMLLVTASYLSGVYGAFGKAAASGAILSTAFVVQFAATLPALQLKWALTRAGRRAFGLAPVWRTPAVAS